VFLFLFRFLPIHSLRACLDDGSPENAIDYGTENWPVPADLRNDLDNIKQRYCAVPLPVIMKDRFIGARDVNEVIKGALVEIHFKLNHYHIRPEYPRENLDSFNGSIQHIRVLQPGEARPVSAYKRKNIRDGPILLSPGARSQGCHSEKTHWQDSTNGATSTHADPGVSSGTGCEALHTPAASGSSTPEKTGVFAI
jgi:hypothetical protein